MANLERNWAIVLAAGDGRRLSSFCTTPEGRVVPKQFCSLRGDRSLLADAVERAAAIVPRARIIPIVAAQHRAFWERDPLAVPRCNLLVQPANRGTAAGILLPLLVLSERDPAARVVVLPSDHYVRDELTLELALDLALQHADEAPASVTLVGATPDSAEPDYGWIEPEATPHRIRRVRRFVEKPDPAQATELYERGCLWNSFILAGRASAFLELFARRVPQLLAAFETVFARREAARGRALGELYARLEPLDFSRELLQRDPQSLRVLELPPCGWTDLGTPRRVVDCLLRHPLRELPFGGQDSMPLILGHALDSRQHPRACTRA